MNLSKVTGKVVATQKDPGLEGTRMLVVQHLRLSDLTPTPGYLVALDSVGADIGDFVIVVTGSSARIAESMKERPVDSAIIGIVDTIELEGIIRYSKRGAALGAAR